MFAVVAKLKGVHLSHDLCLAHDGAWVIPGMATLWMVFASGAYGVLLQLLHHTWPRQCSPSSWWSWCISTAELASSLGHKVFEVFSILHGIAFRIKMLVEQSWKLLGFNMFQRIMICYPIHSAKKNIQVQEAVGIEFVRFMAGLRTISMYWSSLRTCELGISMFQAEGLVEAVFRRQVVWSAFGVELPLLLVIINSHNSPWESQTPSTVGTSFLLFFVAHLSSFGSNRYLIWRLSIDSYEAERGMNVGLRQLDREWGKHLAHRDTSMLSVWGAPNKGRHFTSNTQCAWHLCMAASWNNHPRNLERLLIGSCDLKWMFQRFLFNES